MMIKSKTEIRMRKTFLFLLLLNRDESDTSVVVDFNKCQLSRINNINWNHGGGFLWSVGDVSWQLVTISQCVAFYEKDSFLEFHLPNKQKMDPFLGNFFL